MQKSNQFDRTVEDLGNVVGMEHVNVRVPCQQKATLFYVTGLGLTRDPYLMTGVNNMWVNCGKSQFHLPTGTPQVLRGHTCIVMPDRLALLQRLETVKEQLAGTKFAYQQHADHVAVTCPWGNRYKVFEPGPKFGKMMLGIPQVEFEVPRGTAIGIARFYKSIVNTPSCVKENGDQRCAEAVVGADQKLVYRETDNAQPAYDGHHVAIYISDFSGPYKKLGERGLVSQEDDQHQYRFKDIVCPETGKHLFTIEHEVRSLRHPLFNRPFVNRNPAQSNRVFAAGYENTSWSMPAA